MKFLLRKLAAASTIGEAAIWLVAWSKAYPPRLIIRGAMHIPASQPARRQPRQSPHSPASYVPASPLTPASSTDFTQHRPLHSAPSIPVEVGR